MILDLRRYSQAAIYQDRPLRYSGRRFIVTDLRRYLRRQFIKLERRRCLTAAASGWVFKRQICNTRAADVSDDRAGLLIQMPERVYRISLLPMDTGPFPELYNFYVRSGIARVVFG